MTETMPSAFGADGATDGASDRVTVGIDERPTPGTAFRTPGLPSGLAGGPSAASIDEGLPGLPEVQQALDALDRLEGSPVSEHVAVFESVHRALQTALEEPEQV